MIGAKTKRRRNTGHVSVFEQRQISEFKEAYTKIDQDGDGFIDKEDLITTLEQLGLPCSEKDVEPMLNGSSGSINFTIFLTMFGERLFGTDAESDILGAFEAFDPSGFVDVKVLKEALTTMGDRMTPEQVEQMLSGSTIDGKLNYREWARFART